MNITLRQLEVFFRTAHHQNVSKAAKELRLSQAATSMALAELEKQIGQKLFERRGKSLILNECGKILYPKSAGILSQIDEIQTLFSTRNVGKLKIGASSTIGNYLIPGVIGDFTRQNKNANLTLEVGNSGQIIQAIRDFKIDVGFIEGICHHEEIEIYKWQEDQLVIFASTDNQLTQKKTIHPEELMESNWILREKGSGTREIFEGAIAGKLDNINVCFELGHTEAIKQAVKAGLGISCLSRLAIRDDLKSGALIELIVPYLNLKRNFYLLVHREKFRTDILKGLIRFCMTKSD